ncbi:MAG: bile acid:sodium symporter family protein [Pseudomonadota bacterium]
MTQPLDSVQLNFSPAATLVLQCILALVIFGVSLELSFSDFRRLMREPRPIVAGLLSQLVALPLLTFALVVVMNPHPSLALGLMLVAACPGGNTSNILTHWSGGRTAVSMSLTALSGLISPITTPLTFQLLGSLHPATQAAMRQVSVPFSELLFTIVIALVIPLLVGMTVAEKFPALAKKIYKPLNRFGIGVFILFIVLASAANFATFMSMIGVIFVLVFLHNLLALGTGFTLATLFRVDEGARRAITFESGIHNTALGLTLIFTFFQHLGGMALIAAFWGVWHFATTAPLAWWWAKRPPAAA